MPCDASGVHTRERMPEIGRSGNFLYNVIGKLLGQNAPQAVAEFSAEEFLGGADKIQANHLETLRLGTTEALDGKCEPGLSLIRNRQHATRYITVVCPEMEQRLGFFATDLPRKRRRGGDATAILSDFDGRVGQKILQTGAQLLDKLYSFIFN